MQGLFTLLTLSTLMAVASFLAGILPLSINLSREKLRSVSTIGMGVLVGTSLIVILPEGVETLYQTSSARSSRGGNAEREVQTITNRGELAYQPLPLLTRSDLPGSKSDNHYNVPARAAALEMPGPIIPDSIAEAPRSPGESDTVSITTAENKETQEQKNEAKDNTHHAWVGVALISGFILMFLIDKLPQTTTSSQPKPRTHHIALNNLGGRFNLSTNLDREEEAESFLESSQSNESRRRSFATTIGLVIHAAADGIALGASSSTGQSGLSFIIFFAIMLHKAPAAFGLTSILLRQGLSKRMTRAHLVIFSLAAPAGAILTWLAAWILGAGSAHNAENTTWWTGILLLFSAGTFLYVAMHSMQEMVNSGDHSHNINGQPNGAIGDVQPVEKNRTAVKDVALAVVGMILPLFMQVGHAH